MESWSYGFCFFYVFGIGGIEFTGLQVIVYAYAAYSVESGVVYLRGSEMLGFPVGEALPLGNTLAEENGIYAGERIVRYSEQLYVLLQVYETGGIKVAYLRAPSGPALYGRKGESRCQSL